jgi:hypothetical protein
LEDQLSDDDADQDFGGDAELSAPLIASGCDPIQRRVPQLLSANSNWQSIGPSSAGYTSAAADTQVWGNLHQSMPQEIVELEKQSMLDDFASFAEASLGPCSFEDGTFSDVVSLQAPSLTSTTITPPGGVSHELLVSYLVSMGTNRRVADTLAFGFISQQATANRSQSTRAMDMLEEPAVSPTPLINAASNRRCVPRSVTFSKLDCLEQQQHQDYSPFRTNATSTPSSSSRGYAPISSGSNSAGGGSSAAVRRGEDNFSMMPSTGIPRRPRSYTRADRPGAVEMEGRAFGAPRRAPQVATIGLSSSTRDATNSHDGTIEEGRLSNDLDNMIEASRVNDMPFVVADKLSFKHLLREGPLRKFVILALGLILGVIAIICSLLLTLPGSSPSVPIAPANDGTLTPSSAPTFIREDVLTAAAQITSWDTLSQQDSPQFAAVSWMSTFDQVEIDEAFGEPFLQRYILVVLYFSTMGQDYLEPEGWLNPRVHECGWSSGIFCRTDLTNRLVVFGIDLTRNGASGVLPSELGYLVTAEFIRMPKNKIGGTLPATICNLKNLQALDLGSNMINGQVPSNLANATELSTLIFSDNDLSGLLPKSLWDLTLLRTLDMSSNKLSGSIPSEVEKLQVLVTLDLRENLISGAFPVELAALQKLDFIFLE